MIVEGRWSAWTIRRPFRCMGTGQEVCAQMSESSWGRLGEGGWSRDVQTKSQETLSTPVSRSPSSWNREGLMSAQEIERSETIEQG